MAISLFLMQHALRPLQALVNFFAPPVNAGAIKKGAVRAYPAYPKHLFDPKNKGFYAAVHAQENPTAATAPVHGLPVQHALQHIVRLRRSAESHTGLAGRMVISGRMRDVCATLDRLSAMEQF